MRGLVIKNTGSWYQVKTDEGKLVDCKIKGNFRLKGIRSTNPIAVGDYVKIIVNNEGTAFISEIEDRKNDRADAEGHEAAAQKFKNMFFHNYSYLLLISEKHRLETYSR